MNTVARSPDRWNQASIASKAFGTFKAVDVTDQAILDLVAHEGFVWEYNHDHALQQVINIGRDDAQ